MSHPWKSPVAPLPLNPAPAQHTTSRHGALRPPIFNPYDKFSRSQFDSWIGDITSALRKALRREEEPNKLKGDTSQVSDAPLRARETSEDEVSLSEGQNVGESTEEGGEESDEALEDSFAHLQSRNSKGKAKDTSEGRGSGKGDIDQPIQILDESEEEEEVNQEHSDEGAHRDSSEDFSDSDEEEGEEHPENVASTKNVIELVSSDEDDDGHDEGQEHNESDESEEFDAQQMIFDAQQKQDEDEDEEVESEIDDLPHAESDDQDDEAEEEFLPISPTKFTEPEVELPDPWEGPRTYAEDFYAGGDLVAPAAAGLTPNNLTPLDMTPAESPRGDLVIFPDADEAFTITPGVLSRSPSPEIIEVDTEGLPKSSPPPALSDEDAENGDEGLNDEHLDNEDLYGDLANTVRGSAQRENQDDRARALAFDWNWPPAFSGRVATRPGHLDSEGVQYEDAEDANRDEDDDEDSFGALPLGTSDLDVPEKWAAGADDGQNDDEKLGQVHEGLDEVHEEQDEVWGVEPPMIVLSSDEDEKEDDRIPEMHSMPGGEDSRHVTHHVPSDPGFDPLTLGDFGVAYGTAVADAELTSQTVDMPGQPHGEEGFGDVFDSSFIIPASGANTMHESDVSDEQIEAFFASLQRQTAAEPDNSSVVQDVFSEATDLKEIVGDSSSNVVDIEVAAEGQLNATTGNPSIELSNVAEEIFGADTASGIVEEINPAMEIDVFAQSSDEGTLPAAQSSAPDKVSVSTVEREMTVYVVEELSPESEALSPGKEDDLPDVRSAAPSEAGVPDFKLSDYLVEEVRTEGRVTAEPEAATDETVPSVVQLDNISDAPSARSLAVDLETTFAQDNDTSPIQPTIAHAPSLSTSPLRSSFSAFIPAPVSADPNVPDPASRPHSPPPPSPSSSAAKVQAATPFATAASALRAQDLEDSGFSARSPREGPSGLFTPVPGSLGGGTPTPSDSSIDASEAPRRDAQSVTPKATSNLSLAPVIIADYIAQEDAILGTGPSDQVQSRDSSVGGATDNTAQNGGPLLALFQQYVGRNLSFAPIAVAAGENVVLTTEPNNLITAVGEPDAEQDAASESTAPHIPLEGSPDVNEEVAALSPPVEEQVSAAASVVDTKAKTASSAEDDLGQLQLSYPEGSVSSDEHVGVSASASVDNPLDASEDLDGDTDGDGDLDADADGELDPDYFSDAEQDPFLVRSSHRPIHVNGFEPPLEKTHIEPSKSELPSTPFEFSQVDEENSSERTADRTPERPSPDTEIASSSQVQTENADSSNDEQSSVPSPTESKPASRMLKRKRALPSRSISPRRTRSQTANVTKKQPKGQRAAKNLDKGKGKAKAEAEEQAVPVEEEISTNDAVSDHGSTSSGASAASQMLIAPGMRSRSQSSASATSSAIFQPIPSGRPHIQLVLPPLMHTHSHGFIHHHHGRVPPLPPPAAKPVSSVQPKTLTKSRSTSAEFTSQTSPSQLRSPSRRAPPTTSSPVTRSNCRFHRISVPSQEGGSRSYFIVPGCSLGDGELMKDEEIDDHGFATQDDHARMIADIESLNLNSYLVGILRQLVGVDLLREQEVFYLPNAGEGVHKRTKRRKSAVDELKRRQSTASASYRIPGSPISRSTTPMPTSLQDSASAGVSSGPQKGSRLGGGSTLSGDESELTDYDEQVEDAPKAKRRKLSPTESSASSAAIPSASAPLPSRSASIAEDDAIASASQPIAIRKSKRRPLHADAIAYKPEREDTEESGDVQNSKAKRKKDQPSRVAKRRRMDEISASAPRVKRSRARKSTSVGD